MSGPGLLRTALGLVCAAGLFGVGVQTRAPRRCARQAVVSALEFRVEHDGAGAVRWVVLDGGVQGTGGDLGGVLLADRLSPLGCPSRMGWRSASVSAGQTLASLSLRAVRGAAGVRDAAGPPRGLRPTRRAGPGRGVRRRGQRPARRGQPRPGATGGGRGPLPVERGAAGEWEAELADLDVGVQEGALAAAEAELTRAQGMNLRAEVDAAALGRVPRTSPSTRPWPPSTPASRRPSAGRCVAAGAGPRGHTADGPGLVQVALPERDAGRIRLGAPVAFHGNAGGDEVPGTVLAVSEAAAIGPSGPAVWALVQLDARGRRQPGRGPRRGGGVVSEGRSGSSTLPPQARRAVLQEAAPFVQPDPNADARKLGSLGCVRCLACTPRAPREQPLPG